MHLAAKGRVLSYDPLPLNIICRMNASARIIEGGIIFTIVYITVCLTISAHVAADNPASRYTVCVRPIKR